VNQSYNIKKFPGVSWATLLRTIYRYDSPALQPKKEGSPVWSGKRRQRRSADAYDAACGCKAHSFQRSGPIREF
jgi:hypothetical protein